MSPAQPGIYKAGIHSVAIPTLGDDVIEQSLAIRLGNIKGTDRPNRHAGRCHVDTLAGNVFVTMLYEMTTPIQNDIQRKSIACRRQMPLGHRLGRRSVGWLRRREERLWRSHVVARFIDPGKIIAGTGKQHQTPSQKNDQFHAVNRLLFPSPVKNQTAPSLRKKTRVLSSDSFLLKRYFAVLNFFKSSTSVMPFRTMKSAIIPRAFLAKNEITL